VKPDIENRIAEGAIQSRFEARVVEIRPTSVVIERHGASEELAADAVLLLTGYHSDTELFERAGVAFDPATCVPQINPDTLETSAEGVFLAGAVITGREGGKIFIENGRFHGEQVIGVIARRLRDMKGAVPSCRRREPRAQKEKKGTVPFYQFRKARAALVRGARRRGSSSFISSSSASERARDRARRARAAPGVQRLERQVLRQGVHHVLVGMPSELDVGSVGEREQQRLDSPALVAEAWPVRLDERLVDRLDGGEPVGPLVVLRGESGNFPSPRSTMLNRPSGRRSACVMTPRSPPGRRAGAPRSRPSSLA